MEDQIKTIDFSPLENTYGATMEFIKWDTGVICFPSKAGDVVRFEIFSHPHGYMMIHNHTAWNVPMEEKLHYLDVLIAFIEEIPLYRMSALMGETIYYLKDPGPLTIAFNRREKWRKRREKRELSN